MASKMSRQCPKKWVFTCLLLLLVTNNTRCQKEDGIDSTDSQQSIDEAERREGKPQNSGNGKDTTTVLLLTYLLHILYVLENIFQTRFFVVACH